MNVNNDISIMWRIIENLFYKDNRKNSIILNLQSIWELIYSSQDISKMMKWSSIDIKIILLIIFLFIFNEKEMKMRNDIK